MTGLSISQLVQPSSALTTTTAAPFPPLDTTISHSLDYTPPLLRLPPELIRHTASFLYDPLDITQSDRLKWGIFSTVADAGPDRWKGLNDLISFGASCKQVRKEVREALFRCVRVHDRTAAEDLIKARGDWGGGVRSLILDLAMFDPEPEEEEEGNNGNESGSGGAVMVRDPWQESKFLYKLLTSLPSLTHLSLFADSSDDLTLSLLFSHPHLLTTLAPALLSFGWRLRAAPPLGLREFNNLTTFTCLLEWLKYCRNLGFLCLDADADGSGMKGEEDLVPIMRSLRGREEVLRRMRREEAEEGLRRGSSIVQDVAFGQNGLGIGANTNSPTGSRYLIPNPNNNHVRRGSITNLYPRGGNGFIEAHRPGHVSGSGVGLGSAGSGMDGPTSQISLMLCGPIIGWYASEEVRRWARERFSIVERRSEIRRRHEHQEVPTLSVSGDVDVGSHSYSHFLHPDSSSHRASVSASTGPSITVTRDLTLPSILSFNIIHRSSWETEEAKLHLQQLRSSGQNTPINTGGLVVRTRKEELETKCTVCVLDVLGEDARAGSGRKVGVGWGGEVGSEMNLNGEEGELGNGLGGLRRWLDHRYFCPAGNGAEFYDHGKDGVEPNEAWLSALSTKRPITGPSSNGYSASRDGESDSQQPGHQVVGRPRVLLDTLLDRYDGIKELFLDRPLQYAPPDDDKEKLDMLHASLLPLSRLWNLTLLQVGGFSFDINSQFDACKIAISLCPKILVCGWWGIHGETNWYGIWRERWTTPLVGGVDGRQGLLGKMVKGDEKSRREMEMNEGEMGRLLEGGYGGRREERLRVVIRPLMDGDLETLEAEQAAWEYQLEKRAQAQERPSSANGGSSTSGNPDRPALNQRVSSNYRRWASNTHP